MNNNQNQVILVGFYGGDKTHCLSAWQSTNINVSRELPLSDRLNSSYLETVETKKNSPKKLLKFLAKNKHHTPFEKSCLHFQLKADIATHIHCIKHRIATSINAESARYKELEDKWYIPEDWQEHQFQVKDLISDYADFLVETKTEEKLNIGLHLRYGIEGSVQINYADLLEAYNQLGHFLYHHSCKKLTLKLGRKRAKESSRYFLPYSKQLEFDIMFNFSSFMHFVKLRNSEHAQLEIRAIAQEMIKQVKEIDGNPFKLSLEAFGV